MRSPLHRLGPMVLALCLAQPAWAQAEGDRAFREREALRRTQAALRQAQEQQAAQSREKADLTAQLDAQKEMTQRARAQLATAQSAATQLRSDLAQAKAEVGAVRSRAEADLKVADAGTDAVSKRLDAQTRLATERARTIASVIGLLERALQSLAAAEKANREMHALGLQLIDLLKERTAAEPSVDNDPILGFGKVRLENRAEALRDRLDALRSAPAASDK